MPRSIGHGIHVAEPGDALLDSIVPATQIAARRNVLRARWVREYEPSETQARQMRRRARGVIEWGLDKGSLRFYRVDGLGGDRFYICRERHGNMDGVMEYLTPGVRDMEWAEVLRVAWNLGKRETEVWTR